MSGRSGWSGQVNYDLSGSNPATPLLLQKPKPKIIYGDEDPASLFYGHRWVGWDLEWHPRTSEIYAAAFINYKGEMLALHVQDPEFSGDEGKLLDRILEEITKYPVSFGYYTTGMESYFGKGKNSDLITLRDRLVANGRISSIDIVKPMDGPGRKRPRFAGHLKHTHIDLESIFDNEVVENFIEENNHYRSHKLNYVAKALSGEDSKLLDLNGLKVIKHPVDVQKNYVLWDAVAVYNIITSNVAKEVIELLRELSDVLNRSLEWVCLTTTTVWWTDILDKTGCERPTTYKEPWRPHGGLNLPVAFGKYEHVVLVDVNSLYPTMAIVHNIGFDTINCTCCKDDPLAKVPRYAKIYSKDDKDGYFDPNLEYWICRKRSSKFREKIIAFRDKKDEASKNGQTMRKKIYKLLMNSGYGAHNTNGFGYLFPPVCDLITGFGRYTLRVIRAVAISMGYQIIAGDTDSIFLVGMKTKEDLERFQNRCQELLRVHDPSLDRDFDVVIENKIFDTPEKAPISFEKFYCAMKKHYYGFTPGGKYDGTKMEVNKDDRPEYSNKILWEQWKADLNAGKNPIDNFKRLISKEELQNVLENDPDILRHSSKLGENPGYVDEETGEILECTYTNVNDPKAVIGRELSLSKGDIAYFFKAGKNKSTKKNQRTDDSGKEIGTFTINPRYASIDKIREDLIEAFLPHIRIVLNRPILKGSKKKENENKLVDKQIKKEVFGI